jgi:uncharacterized membrane protein YqiK
MFTFISIIFILGALVALLPFLLGIVIISESQVGIVVKKFSGSTLDSGKLVATNGEAGYQADTLAPGWHFGYFPWQYSVEKKSVIVVPQGEIALIVANDGLPIPANRILGKVVDCNDFQDGKSFLLNGGEKGRQLGILTAGTYRINTALFTVITQRDADAYGMYSNAFNVYQVSPDMVGIVTTLDGIPIENGEIAGTIIPEHDNFQNAQAFMSKGGRRGLQEQILLSGSWNLNPWFVRVEQVQMTEIPIGRVGVVISYVGKEHKDVSGDEFKHGDLVNVGHKGVWVTPLYPGKHPLNTKIMKVELVPTTNIVLNWATRTEAHRYDEKLSSITVRSKDGFSFNLDVAQIIHVAALEAPKVISRVGSMQNLIDHVLEPIVGNYFRNSAQDYTVLDFLSNRTERQKEAFRYILDAIKVYDVQAVDTLIGDIVPPAQLMQTQTDRKIAEEQKKTYEVQEAAQTQRQQLMKETALAEIQAEMVKSEQGVKIAELHANSKVNQTKGEAEAIKLKAGGDAEALRLQAIAEAESVRIKAIAEAEALKVKGFGEAEAIKAIGDANANAYQLGVNSLGINEFTLLQLIQIIGENKLQIVPNIQVSGGGDSKGTLTEALLGMLLQQNSKTTTPLPNLTSTTTLPMNEDGKTV